MYFSSDTTMPSPPSILLSTSAKSNGGGAAREAHTPKRSQAESGLWSHRAGRTSHATFHDPSPGRRPRSPPPGNIACHIEAEALEWWRRLCWSTNLIGFSMKRWWCAGELRVKDKEVKSQGLHRVAQNNPSITGRR